MAIRKLFIPSVVEILRAGYGGAALRGDIFGGLTAAVVALPLALAFGVASGAGPVAGLYGAIATGFFAALFGGTPVQISGPTGPMTVVMGAIVATHATNLPEAFTIVMLGGLLQCGFGVLGLGRYVVYTPVSVVSGFMSGIGVIILIIQTLPFLGMPTSTGGVVGTLQSLVALRVADIIPQAVAVAAGALLLIVAWPARLAQYLPAPLGVLLLGTAISALWLPGVPVIGTVPSGFPTLVMPDLSPGNLPALLQGAFILALLGSIDSLLTSLVADSMTKSRHDSDKELVGQGIGNLVAGMLGAIPGAGATMRTVINVRAGGRTAISGMLHALLLLALALGMGSIVAFVPHAVLAAILMKVGWDIIDWGYWKRLRRIPREKAIVMLVTFGLTVFVDLITAVAVGIILASFVNSRWLALEQLKGLRQYSGENYDQLTDEERSMLRQVGGRILLTQLHGSFSYASARDLARRDVQGASDIDAVIYDFSAAAYMDPSAALAIDEMVDLSLRNGREVFVCGLRDEAYRALNGMGVLDRIPATRRFAARNEAIAQAVAFCHARATGPGPGP